MSKSMKSGWWSSAAVGAAALAQLILAPAAQAEGSVVQRIESRTIVAAESPALRDIKPVITDKSWKAEVPNHLRRDVPGALFDRDGALQTVYSNISPLAAVGLSFPGLGEGDYGYSVNVAPPDTVGEAGTTQYVQWVNVSLAVFDKATGGLVAGPIAGNQLFSGLGNHPCANTNNGDPIVVFDQIANRWVLSQFSVQGPYFECVAVSKTDDAAGEYWLYAFEYADFNDYPKMSVWPDGYYVTYNMFNGTTFAFEGARICALERSQMLVGGAAREVCVQLSSNFYGVLPSDVDGDTLPAAGTPNFLLDINSTSSYNLFKFVPNYASPNSSTFQGPINIPVASFISACRGGNCVPQPQTRNKLDSLSSLLMFRNAYRQIGTQQSLVVTQSVGLNAQSRPTGVRWYEFRVDGSNNVSVYQQGTYAPDSDYRWLGSSAMDKFGNIAVGYSISSGSRFPSIGIAGRTPSDPLGQLSAETVIVNGSGSQINNLTRWGDYAAMTVDPVDDCTFWFTTEYIKQRGSFNWSTQIATYKFPGC